MSFTYSADLITAVDKLRFELGDILLAPAGILPTGANVPNETITAVLSLKNGNSDLAFIALCQSVSSQWSTSIVEHAADGLMVKRQDTATYWKHKALERERAIQATAGYVGYAHEVDCDCM